MLIRCINNVNSVSIVCKGELFLQDSRFSEPLLSAFFRIARLAPQQNSPPKIWPFAKNSVFLQNHSWKRNDKEAN
jgi:hypothetical protein